MRKSSIETNEENERTKGKEKENESKKTLILKRNIQRVELQGKRGKIKAVTTQITKELLEYIKKNFDGYSLLVLSYIILGALISIRRLFLNAYFDTDEFLNEKLGLGKTKYSKNQSRQKSKDSNSYKNTWDYKFKTTVVATTHTEASPVIRPVLRSEESLTRTWYLPVVNSLSGILNPSQVEVEAESVMFASRP